jgi:radical SAM-linked protein
MGEGFVMSLIRMEFEKTGRVRYISHLDLVRLFQRAMRRAGIPVAYSKGFNPHARISFGPALALGISSEREYMDVELESDIKPGEMIDRLNACLPDGIKVRSARIMPTGVPALAASINASQYSIQATYSPREEGVGSRIRDFFLAEHAYIERVDKKRRVKKVDVIPMILDVKKVEVGQGILQIVVVLVTGSSGNLKPDDLLKALQNYAGVELTGIRIHREGLFIWDDGVYRTPFEHD